MPTTPVTRRIGGRSASRSVGMREPHERDESSTDAMKKDELAPVQADQMEQARRDLESPQQDTDCYKALEGKGGACPQPDSLPEPPSMAIGEAREAERDRSAGRGQEKIRDEPVKGDPG